MRFRLSTCIKAGARDAPDVAAARAAGRPRRGPRAAREGAVAVVVAGLESVCWETEAVWAV